MVKFSKYTLLILIFACILTGCASKENAPNRPPLLLNEDKEYTSAEVLGFFQRNEDLFRQITQWMLEDKRTGGIVFDSAEPDFIGDYSSWEDVDIKEQLEEMARLLSLWFIQDAAGNNYGSVYFDFKNIHRGQCIFYCSRESEETATASQFAPDWYYFSYENDF
ncbi:MAG: hypothetical protein FWF85_09895 [Clostridiales bacterium]|jgi:hypothetical protein|nr:hypothetical protein [Clostridiales bacterium]MDR2711764.1 hypothetical protein [Clostridiales bacterium]